MPTKVDINNPFMVQEWIRRGIASAREIKYSFEYTVEERLQAGETIKGMERSLMSLNGICVLHMQQEYRRELGKIAWWKFRVRRDFERNKFEWEMAKREALIAEAAAVESFEL